MNTYFIVLGLGILSAVVILIVVTSILHKKKLQKLITKEVTLGSKDLEKIMSEVGYLQKGKFKEYLKEDLALGALCLADIVYDATKINPYFLEAVDFASVEKINNFFDLKNYVENNFSALPDVSKEGFINRLKGYVGERVSAEILKAEGHTVVFPESPTQEGFDIIVDGEPVNVKTVETQELIEKHLEKYPNYRVIVPEEMKESFEDNPNVISLKDFSEQEVEEMTREQMDTADKSGEIGDLLPTMLIFSSTMSIWRNYKRKDLNAKGKLKGVGVDLTKLALSALFMAIPGGGFWNVLQFMMGGKIVDAIFSKILPAIFPTKAHKLEEKLIILGGKYGLYKDKIEKNLSLLVKQKQARISTFRKIIQNNFFSLKEWLYPSIGRALVQECIKKEYNEKQLTEKLIDGLREKLQELYKKHDIKGLGTILLCNNFLILGIPEMEGVIAECKDLIK